MYETVRPFHPQRLSDFLLEDFPDSVVRVKGFLWLPNYNDFSILMEQAGRNIEIYPVAYWKATLTEEELAWYLKDDPELMEKWDQEYGDRRNQLVFIGIQLDKEAIVAQLDRCLLSDEEMRGDWNSLPDPFEWEIEEQEDAG